MTEEILQKALTLKKEIDSLTLAAVPGAKNIVPTSITYSFVERGIEGRDIEYTSDVNLSSEMRQIIQQIIEDRINDLKNQLTNL